MEMAVETEKNGRRFYEAVAGRTQDAKLKDLFGFLAEEESRHITTFQSIARALKEKPEDLAYDWQEAARYLDAVVESKYFLGTGKALPLIEECRTPADALNHAIGFEKETLLFYSEILEMVSASVKPVVRKLITEEQSHVAKLSEARKALGSGLEPEEQK